MVLSDDQARMAQEAGVAEEEVRGASGAITTALLAMWGKAAEDPLIFSGFSIPQRSAPNAVLVHNWTFASLGLARSLGRDGEMAEALNRAACNPMLGDAIAIARAVRGFADETQPFDVETIGREGREPFYASVGQRLLLLADIPPTQRDEILRALMEGCLRLGPHGLDAGVFVAAALYETGHALPADELRTYRQRLENRSELRIGLSPLVDRLGRTSDA